MNYKWIVIPPNYVILVLSIVALTLAMLGFKENSSKLVKLRSWVSTVLSSMLIIIMFVIVSFTTMFSGSKELLTTTHSPDKQYTINFYKTDAGAMGSISVIGELKGPLWLKKLVYFEQKVDQIELKWDTNHTVRINDHKVNLMEGESWISQ